MAAITETTTATETTLCIGAASPLRPAITIPVIDISGYLASSPEDTTRIANAVHAAATVPGFFQIIGHSVSSDLRDRLLTMLRAFYALPAPTKQALHRANSACMRGYEAVGEQELEPGVRDLKEGFMIGRELPEQPRRFGQGPNQWPAEEACPGFRAALTEYFDEMRKLSVTMFRIMALSLGLDERYFDAFADSAESITMCRAHRYPPTTPGMASAAVSKGIGAHTDFGALTLLLQDDVGGLEVFHRPSQTWHPVKPVKDAYVVNIGDMMERWTNDIYSSTLHRVISPASTKDRYSVAFFNEGLPDQLIECIPTCLKLGERPLHGPVTVEDHLRSRYSHSY